MTRTFTSLEDVIVHLDRELAELRAQHMAGEAIALIMLERVLETNDLGAVMMRAHAQLDAIEFSGGEAHLNEALRAAAHERIEHVFRELSRVHDAAHASTS